MKKMSDSRFSGEIQTKNAVGKKRGQKSDETHLVSAPNRKGGQMTDEIHKVGASLSETIQAISEQWRRRQSWHRAEKSLTLQIRAFCRRLSNGEISEANVLYDALMKNKPHEMKDILMLSVFPLIKARNDISRELDRIEKNLEMRSRQLPGIKFVTSTPGLSIFTLFALIGECPGHNFQGFIDFDTPSRVWKRLGLAVMPDGTRQRKVKGPESKEHGYSPSRRSVIWTIGDACIKGKGPYRKLYDQYKEQEQKKAAGRGLIILPSAQINATRKASGKYISEGHIHNSAKRKMEKDLVKDVWLAFRTEAGVKSPNRAMELLRAA